MLDRRKIRHNVLNAKNHAKEAEIIETDTVIETVRGVGYRLRGKNDETV